ncbi:MAG: Cytochrome c-type biogenesis protein CcmE [Cellvibrionales bacterium UBA7375]|nr:MAG: Cytochrome c-type biogenesis protein CcmE [Cellvibrionales bacterium UBA7375]
MHPIRKQRLQIVLLIVVASSLAAGLIAYMLGQNANYFFTPSQVLQGEAPVNVTIRAGGMVVQGSIERSADSLDVSFLVTDGLGILKVSYSGILPDLFAEGEAAIATGKLGADKVLRASQVLAKHDENYTPPEVADAMNQAYKLKQQGKYSPQEAEK